MKKQYIAPEVEIENIVTEQMLTASIGIGPDAMEGEGAARERELFTEEEEDELWY